MGEKLNPKRLEQPIQFDVKAKLEEKERKSGQITILFMLVMRTKPSVVKYGVKGTAILQGKTEQIEKILEIDPETKIPHVLHMVYKHVFTVTYLLSTILNAPHPPSDLLHSEEEKLGIPPEEEEALASSEETVAEEASTETEKAPTEAPTQVKETAPEGEATQEVT
jgi:hypothetical protein